MEIVRTMTDAAAGVKPRICFVVSSLMTAVAFLTDHMRALSAKYEVHLVANAEPAEIARAGLQCAAFHRVRIERRSAPFYDFQALCRLVRVLNATGFSPGHSVTPTA